MTRVLFIDDEPLILRALARSLRVRRVPWSVEFVESGYAALDLLAREPFDVVVADLRIPDLDGVEVLTEVQRTYPRTARLVLSGQVGTDDCLRAMRVAHQCLAKPCNLDLLCEAVKRITWSYSLLDDDSLTATIAQLSCLPTPPRVHVEVCSAIARGAGLAKIASIIDDDLALTTKLLQIVNSAFFTQGIQVTTVERALTVLGTDVVCGLLLGEEVFRAFDGKLPARVAELRAHSKLVAMIARQLAPADLAGDAFVAGMLHDIGDLVLAVAEYEAVRPFDHARAGGFLLGLWGVAPTIVEAIAYHHDPGKLVDDRVRLVDVLHAAATVAGELQGRGDVISMDWHARNPPAQLERARTIGRQLWAS